MDSYETLDDSSARGLVDQLSPGVHSALSHFQNLEGAEQFRALMLSFGMFDGMIQQHIATLSSLRSEDLRAAASIFTRCSNTLEFYARQLDENGQDLTALPE